MNMKTEDILNLVSPKIISQQLINLFFFTHLTFIWSIVFFKVWQLKDFHLYFVEIALRDSSQQLPPSYIRRI